MLESHEREIGVHAAPQLRRQVRNLPRIELEVGDHVLEADAPAEMPGEIGATRHRPVRQHDVRGDRAGQEAQRRHVPGEIPQGEALDREPVAGSAPQRALGALAGDGAFARHDPARRQA